MTFPGHHTPSIASASGVIDLPTFTAPTAVAPPQATQAQPRVQMKPATRRLIYVGLYEALSILFTMLVLGSVLGHEGGQSTLTAVLLSTVATIWNYAWNTLFERAERRFGWTGRGLGVRVLHAIGYEGGVLIFTIPLVAFMLQVGFLEALAIETSLLVFFLVFTFVYSWVFDRVLGLPESAR